jgi:hypothetical protein
MPTQVPKDAERGSDRGKRATFDRRTGAVSGSGSDIGNPGQGEDYDSDLTTGSGGDSKAGGPSNSA